MKYTDIQYYDTYSILVININSRLRRLYCPFMVLCEKSIDEIQENSCVYVDEVFQDKNNLILFKIGGKVYNYSNFSILINY